MIQQFGSSKEFVKSAAVALDGKAYLPKDISPSNFIEAAIQVARCGYECGTFWGKKVYNINNFIFQTISFAKFKYC